MDVAYRHVGSSQRGIAHTLKTHTHSHRKQGEAETSLGRAMRGKKLGLQGGQLSADSASPPLSVTLQAAY